MEIALLERRSSSPVAHAHMQNRARKQVTFLIHSHQNSKHIEKQARAGSVPKACIQLSLAESWSWWIRHTLQNNKDQAAFSETYCREINCPFYVQWDKSNQFSKSCIPECFVQVRNRYFNLKIRREVIFFYFPVSCQWSQHKLRVQLHTRGGGGTQQQCHKTCCQCPTMGTVKHRTDGLWLRTCDVLKEVLKKIKNVSIIQASDHDSNWQVTTRTSGNCYTKVHLDVIMQHFLSWINNTRTHRSVCYHLSLKCQFSFSTPIISYL